MSSSVAHVLRFYFERAVLPFPDLTALAVPLAFATVALELGISIGVWFSRLRPIVFGVAGPLHLGMLTVAFSGNDLLGVVLFAGMMFALLTTFLYVPQRGRTVVWDDTCSFCRRWVWSFQRLDGYHALRFIGASDTAAYRHTSIAPRAAIEAMQLVEPDGTVRSGFDAVRGIIAVLPGGFLIAPWMALPGVRHLGRWAYHQVALRRTCAYTAVGAPVPTPEG